MIFRERDVAVVGDDKTEETEGGIRGCDCHGLILNAFLECFEGLPVGFLGRGCKLGHVPGSERKEG